MFSVTQRYTVHLKPEPEDDVRARANGLPSKLCKSANIKLSI